jgi:kinesin family protein 2/24
VGVEDAEERKKLYFLVQRLQKILNNKSNAEDGEKKESLSTSDKAGDDKDFGDREREDSNVVTDTSSLSAPKHSVDVKVKVARKSSIPQTGSARSSTSSVNDGGLDTLRISSDNGRESEEDLRKLRRRGRPSIDPLGVRNSRDKERVNDIRENRERAMSDIKPDDAITAEQASVPVPVPKKVSGVPTRAPSRRSTMSVSSAGVSESLDKLSFKDKDSDSAVVGAGSLVSGSNLRQRRSGGRLSLSSESLKTLGERGKLAGTAAGAGVAMGPRPATSAGSGIGSRTSSKSSLSSSMDQPLPPPPAEASIQTVVKSHPSSMRVPAAPSKRAAAGGSGDSISSGGSGEVGIANSVRSESPIQHVDKPLSPRNGKQRDVEGSFFRDNSGDKPPQPPLPPTFPMDTGIRDGDRDRDNSGRYGVDEGEAEGGSDAPTSDFGEKSIGGEMPLPPDLERVSSNYEGGEGDDDVEDMAIRVVVRKRPLNRNERMRGDRDVLEARKGGQVLMHEPKTRVDLTRVVETSHFVFDDSFESGDSNEGIYQRTVKPLVNFAFEGGKASCFAYGQTGSGKTFTLMGANPENPAEVRTNAGLYVLAARDLFAYLLTPEHAGLACHLSCFEIYGGKLFDLLNERNLVKCLEDSRGNVRIPALKEFEVSTVQGLLDHMSKAHDNRSIGCTGANETSSRSHLVMQLLLKKRQEKKAEKPVRARRRSTFKEMSAIEEELGPDGHGKITFIDLAGSERGADTTHNSKQTRMEGADINTSLLALKEVIRALANRALEKKGLGVGPRQVHTPFRGSKLTQVLKDSFVGDMTRTCMIACVSPAHSNCEHTLNTLRYADRVKEHQTNPDAVAEHAHVEEGDEDENKNINNRAGVVRKGTSVESSPIRNGRKVAPVVAERPSTSSGRAVDAGTTEARNASRPSTSGGVPPRRGSGNNGVPQNGLAPSLSSKAAGSPHRGSSSGMRAAAASTSQPPLQTPALQAKSNSHVPALEGKSRPGPRMGGETSSDNADGATLTPKEAPFEDTENLARTVSLLSAHKRSISETVQSMKSEMELVQAMEDSEDRDVQLYIGELKSMLDRKEGALKILRDELRAFKKSRK